MSAQISLLIFWLDEDRFAIPLDIVDQVHQAVEISSMPDQPPGTLGFINVHGAVIPVVDVRTCCGLPKIELEIEHMLLIVRDGERRLAIVVDKVEDVISYNAEQIVIADSLLYANSKVKILKLQDGMPVLNELRDYLSHRAKVWLSDN